jgi:hypothetical protein
VASFQCLGRRLLLHRPRRQRWLRQHQPHQPLGLAVAQRMARGARLAWHQRRAANAAGARRAQRGLQRCPGGAGASGRCCLEGSVGSLTAPARANVPRLYGGPPLGRGSDRSLVKSNLQATATREINEENNRARYCG